MNEFMNIALKEAEDGMNENAGGPFGAVIVKGEKIIAKAHNEVIKSNDPTAHAEILAIRRAASSLGTYELWGCEIYSSSEPCPMCFAAIYWARIKKIYYALTRKDTAALGFDDKHIFDVIKGKVKRELDMVQIDRENSLPLIQKWEEKGDKIIY